MEGHICRQNWCLLWYFVLNCVHAPPARAVTAILLWKSDSWRQALRLKLPKKSWTVPQCGHVTPIVYKWRRSNQMLSFHRTFFNLLDFTVLLSCRDWHSETPWSHSSNQPGGTYCQAQDFLLRTNYTLEMWCANTKSANQVPPALWKHLSFQCLGVIVALNGKRASMLLEPTKNKLKQWRVIEKSVNKCIFSPRFLKIITKWMKITDSQICEDQIVTFKQSHILLYQGLLFLTPSTCVIVDARSHTCKSHDFIPRYDINILSLWLVWAKKKKICRNKN